VQHHKAKARHATIYASPLDLDDHFEPPHFPKNEGERAFIDDALGDNFIFSHITVKERGSLIDAMERHVVKSGTEVIRQGDKCTMGLYFYILQEGAIDYIADGEKVGTCELGGSFGELALLYDSPRAASCVATKKSVLWKVDQLTFRHMLARASHEAQKNVCASVKRVALFEHLSHADLSKFAEALTPVNYAESERIVTKGDVGEIFYIIQAGTVRCHDIGGGEAHYSDLLLNAGDFFGERALLLNEPRAANVTAVTDVMCLCLERETFESCIGPLHKSIDHGLKKKVLETLPIFTDSNFERHEIDELASLVSEQCFLKGEKLCEAGKPYRQDLWIVEKGKIVVTNKAGELFAIESGDYFGDKSIKSEPGHISSHTAIFEDNTECYVLSRSDIESVIGDINRLGEYIPFTPSKVNKTLRFEDIKRHRILGMGAFGKVWLTSTKKDNTPYALKQLDKRELIKGNQVKSIHREKNIMYSIEHPFLLSLISSFQDEDHLYLVLELIQGGELFNVVHTDSSHGLPNNQAIFYAACVIEALGHLHLRSICYRDLKPENVMVNADGYCTVIDMGFSKVVMEKTYTLCGTPEYLAPEIIMSKGHDKAVDYWAFGVLVYEMLVGKSPFFSPGIGQMNLFKRIVTVKYNIPKSVSDAGKDLIKKLLTRRQASRIGNLSRGHKDIQDHAWFKDIVWKKLVRKQIKAPWVPEIKDPFDASHFDDYSSSEHESRRVFSVLGDEEQSLFKDF
jgi:protein kinase A